MVKKDNGTVEVARVVRKSKSPYMKSTIVLMSDGSSWERLTCHSPSGKKVRGNWSMINRVSTNYTREMFVGIFTRGGWKEKKVSNREEDGCKKTASR